jgi:hypothetical protein
MNGNLRLMIDKIIKGARGDEIIIYVLCCMTEFQALFGSE